MLKILRWLGMAATAAFLISIYTPLWNAAAVRLTVKPSTGKADAIVVLGAGGTTDGRLSDDSLRRAVVGIQLFKQRRGSVLILSGPREGTGKSQAEIRADLAIEMGIPAESIKIVTRVSTTRDEAVEVASMLAGRHEDTVLLVTDSLHMRRAQRVFESTGLTTMAAPSDDISAAARTPAHRIELIYSVLQQSGALLYYKLAGFI
jgi:uncharacterized SAM-binding protein YcdF (DUF218 family)